MLEKIIQLEKLLNEIGEFNAECSANASVHIDEELCGESIPPGYKAENSQPTCDVYGKAGSSVTIFLRVGRQKRLIRKKREAKKQIEEADKELKSIK